MSCAISDVVSRSQASGAAAELDAVAGADGGVTVGVDSERGEVVSAEEQPVASASTRAAMRIRTAKVSHTDVPIGGRAGTPSAANLLISAQSSKVITLQSSSAHRRRRLARDGADVAVAV
jgi:hypothetical protein